MNSSSTEVRGHIEWLRKVTGQAGGSLGAKTRPVLVVTVEYDDVDRALVTVVPHTTELRQTRFEIPVKASFLRPGAFLVQGIATYPKTWAVRKFASFRTTRLTLL